MDDRRQGSQREDQLIGVCGLGRFDPLLNLSSTAAVQTSSHSF